MRGLLRHTRLSRHCMAIAVLVLVCIMTAPVCFGSNDASTTDASPRAKKLMDAIGCTTDEAGNYRLDCAVIDPKTRIISFPAKTNIVGDTIEVLISTEQGRTHESLFITELDPFKLHLALILADYRNGAMMADADMPQGALFDVMVCTADGKEVKADGWLYCEALQGKKPDGGYAFVGSQFINNSCVASSLGNLVNINSSDSDTIINAVMSSENLYREYKAVKSLVPQRGTAVTIRLVPRGASTGAVSNALEATAPLKKMSEEELASIRGLFSEIRFTGSSIFLDYDKMISALSVRIPPNHPSAAKEIIEKKKKLADEFLELYDKEYMMAPYIRISEAREWLAGIGEIYAR